jgi:hypothetical protein
MRKKIVHPVEGQTRTTVSHKGCVGSGVNCGPQAVRSPGGAGPGTMMQARPTLMFSSRTDTE